MLEVLFLLPLCAGLLILLLPSRTVMRDLLLLVAVNLREARQAKAEARRDY